MTIQQLSYIIAVDTYKNFKKAADKCFVTQPTLSMQILSLEEEFGVKIFDRTKKPVITTDIGKQIIEQARVIFMNPKSSKRLSARARTSWKGRYVSASFPRSRHTFFRSFYRGSFVNIQR